MQKLEMNAFLSVLTSYKDIDTDTSLRRTNLEILQVNMGNLCNQSCSHCHVEASPRGEKIMPRKVIDDIINFLSDHRGLILDVTGGAPELNPHFDYFLTKARPLVGEIIVRSNLTVFFEPGKAYLPRFFKKHSIHLICSLPCYEEEKVDIQRGKGAFNKSIRGLRLLNEIGYSKTEDLTLDLVYNPTGAYLPPQQEALEKDYKYYLKGKHGVEFNRLVTIANVPIKRFKKYLDSQGQYDNYLKLLKDNFNPGIVENIMCKRYLSVGYDGKPYDCDFNQSLGWVLKDRKGKPLAIDRITSQDLEGRDIMVGEHCLSCTAGYGSSCQGALSNEGETVKDAVKYYYGKIVKESGDLKTSACCSIDVAGSGHEKILAKIHPEILNKFYGCGSPIPPILEGCKALDLGCGTGRDAYLVSALVGEKGSVLGVDMTDEQLETAEEYIDYHMKNFNFSRPNVRFKKGYIENLKGLGIEDASYDVVISNCVINLSPDKKAVFKEIFRVLKPGGELYFSDIFTGKRIPEYLKLDPVLYGECLGGALYIEDFRRILRDAGCPDYRVVSKRRITLENPEIRTKAGMIDFYSMTIRAFKLDDLEDTCEDYGQIATYLGSIPGFPHRFELDERHIFIAKKPVLVCGNTASMLKNTCYSGHFSVMGDRSTHFGPFDCKPAAAKIESGDSSVGGSCC